jgi:hypothetical protein
MIPILLLSSVLILDIPEDITQKGRMDVTVTTTKHINVDRTKFYPKEFNCPCNYCRKLTRIIYAGELDAPCREYTTS